MTDQDVNIASENKTAEVAPYLSTKKEDENETGRKTSTIIPVIIILAIAVTVIASFFEDEYKSLIANFNPDANSTPASEEVVVAISENKQKTVTTLRTNSEMETTATPAAIEQAAVITVASAQAQPGLITVYNPYLKPYPQIYAPIPVQVPYGMPPQQAKAYIDMMQQHQMAVARMVEMSNTAMQRMKQQRTQAQKAHAEMVKKKQAASRI